MRKLSTITLLFLLFICAGIAISLRFFPSLYVAAFNGVSDQQLSFEKLDVSFFPLTLTIEQLNYNNVNGQTIASAKQAKLLSEPLRWMRGHNNFWKLAVDNAIVKLHHFPETSASENDDVDNTANPFNVHRIVSGLNMDLRSITIEFDEHSTVGIKRFSTKLNDPALLDFNKVKQDVDFSIEYLATNNSAPLVIEGLLQSRMVKGVSTLAIELTSLDLDPVFSANKPSKESSATAVETEVDWRWLAMLDPLKLDLKVGKLVWAKSSANDIELTIGLDDDIDFSAQSQLTWFVSDEVSLTDTLSLNGVWNAISATSMGADLRGNLELTTSVLSAEVEGDVNVNGNSGNQLSIHVVSRGMPVTTPLDSDSLSLVDQYFPIDVSLELEQLDQLTRLGIVSAKFGESDIKGSLEINQQSAGSLSINSILNSEKIVYQALEDNISEELIDADVPEHKPLPTVIEGDGETVVTETSSSARLFSDEAIDWAWIDGLVANINWRVETFVFDNIEVTDVNLPIKLHDGMLDLKLDAQSIASGTLKLDSLLKKNDQEAEMSLNLVASGIVLEQLKLLPPEELQKGLTDLRLNLTSKGNTNQELASSLNGTVKVEVGSGVLGSNSFELIGSDLILGMLNKLNPFAKSDKTTELQCAVVNLNIVNGKIDIDKSLAIKTSKLEIVADGYMDLATEKIKLNITPKARSGVGVDASSLVKFVALGGTLKEPKPVITASGAIKSAAIVGAAVSTGGLSLLAANAAEKTLLNIDVCERAVNAFGQAGH